MKIISSYHCIRRLLVLALTALIITPAVANTTTSILPLATVQIASRVHTAEIQCSESLACASEQTARYYSLHNFHPIWISKDGTLNTSGSTLIQILRTSYEDGLDPQSYHLAEIDKLVSSAPITPSVTTINASQLNTLVNLDMTLTDAFFLYANNLHNGIVDYSQEFPDWHIAPTKVDLIQTLNHALLHNNMQPTLQNLTPKYPGYAKLKQKLASLRAIATTHTWPDIASGNELHKGDSGSRIRLVQQHLLITGELQAIQDEGEFDDDTESAVMHYQENMGLLDSGIVDQDTIDALNVPVTARMQQIEANMDVMRFLPSYLETRYVMVNLPAYSLKLMSNKQQIFSMDVAVGSRMHQSCVLKSAITRVVVNPTWYMPASIAESDVFPMLQSGSNYLQTHSIDILENIGNGRSRIINQDTINWKKMTLEQFQNNYRFQQRPGSDNVLGKVKFMFDNPCEIYLHDSIESAVFDASERNVSHGCIRLGKPFLLSDYLFGTINHLSPSAIARLFATGHNKSTKLANSVPLYIVYLTAWVSEDGTLQFRNDIYNLIDPQKYTVTLDRK